MSATIADVAAHAGVSTATVSRAMRGLDGVSSQARQKVLASARDLGYVISPSAHALATGQTGVIAVILPAFNKWFPSSVLEGAQRRLQAAGYITAVHSATAARGRTAYDVSIAGLRRKVDGILNIALPLRSHEVAEVESLGVPVVAVGNTDPPFGSVSLDDHEAGEIATRHLIDLGHRVIAYLSGSPEELDANTPGGQRLRGWVDALRDAGLDCGEELIVASYFDIRGGHDGMIELLARRPDVTAVFAATDTIARGALLALAEHGVKVPEDISIVSVDGEDPGPWLPLTTVVQDPANQGRLAAEQLLSMINDATPPRETTIHGTLRLGRTTAAPGARGATS